MGQRCALMTAIRVAAERQASAGARDGVKDKRNDLAARAPLHALVGPRRSCNGEGSSDVASKHTRPDT